MLKIVEHLIEHIEDEIEGAKEYAEKYPDIEFCQATCSNANERPVLDNYHTFMGTIYEGRYISGYVAGNVLNGKMTPLYWRELRDADLSKVTLVDVRTVEEFELGTISGAINIPLDDLRGRIGEIPKDKPVYLFFNIK